MIVVRLHNAFKKLHLNLSQEIPSLASSAVITFSLKQEENLN